MNSAATTSFQMQGDLEPVPAQGLATTLTPRQIDFVQRAAGLLPVTARAQFQQAVADLLAHAVHGLDDRTVLDVLRIVLAKHGHSISAVFAKPPREFARIERKTRHDASPVFRP